MAHCPISQLADLTELLESLRSLPGLRETKPGIFYLRGKGFLHFHLKDGRRWADVRAGADWGDPLDVPFGASADQQAQFLADVQQRLALSQGAQR